MATAGAILSDDDWRDTSVRLALASILFPLAVVLLASANLASGLALAAWNCRAILALAAILSLAAGGRAVLRWPGAVLAVTGIALFAIAALAVDVTYDGQEYHYDAVWSLVHGWNPYHEPYGRLTPPGATPLPWPGHYPTGTWLLMAVAALAGSSLEAAKGMLLLPVSAVPLAWYPALRRMGLSPLAAGMLGGLAALSPIALDQAATRMVDGTMATLAEAFAGFAANALTGRSRHAIWGALACLALAIDIKFNAFAILGTLALAWCIARMRAGGWRAASRLAGTLALVTGLAVVGPAYHPLVSNVQKHGQPFWPVLGAPELDIIPSLVPPELRGFTPFKQFAHSLLATSGGNAFDVKPPFVIRAGEFTAMKDADPMQGGFGPLMTGAMLLAGIAALAGMRNLARRPDRQFLLMLAAAAAASSLVTPYNWWPRYIPQFWLGTVLAAIFAVTAEQRAARVLGWACAAVLAANSAFVGAAALTGAIEHGRKIGAEVAFAQRQPGGVCLNAGRAHARIGLFEHAGVRVFPLAFPLPPTCRGARLLDSAHTFDWQEAAICPCQSIPNAPVDWAAAPDPTLEDVRLLQESTR